MCCPACVVRGDVRGVCCTFCLFSSVCALHLVLFLQVGLPDAEARLAMVERCFQKVHLAPDVDLPAVAEGLAGATGADIAHACREALMLLLRRDLARNQAAAAAANTPHAAQPGVCVRSSHTNAAADRADVDDSDILLTAEDLEATMARARRSVSAEEVARFEGMRDALASGSLPPPPPRAGRGSSEQVERLATAMLRERATARISELQALLRDAAGVMQAQRAALEARGPAAGGQGSVLGSSGVGVDQKGVEHGAMWDKVMAAVASLGDGDAAAAAAAEGDCAEEDALMVE